jgi:hypothetical protein
MLNNSVEEFIRCDSVFIINLVSFYSFFIYVELLLSHRIPN